MKRIVVNSISISVLPPIWVWATFEIDDDACEIKCINNGISGLNSIVIAGMEGGVKVSEEYSYKLDCPEGQCRRCLRVAVEYGFRYGVSFGNSGGVGYYDGPYYAFIEACTECSPMCRRKFSRSQSKSD